MVGLLGQKINWYGEDNEWCCLLADSTFQLNARVTAPLPEEFPTRQLLSGVSLITPDGHSLVIEVKNPYSRSCLAEGSLRILVDGQESESLETPGEDIILPGGVVVSSANLPVVCRPFGGHRIWAAQLAAMDAAINHRSLRGRTPFVDWLLESDTITAPVWCAEFVGGKGPAGMSEVQSNHAILRIETSTVTIRVNIGVNYQNSKTDAAGSVLIPELEFWQTDLAFEGLPMHGETGGLLGDTSQFVLDNDGVPITSGMGAVHGPVKNYRVSRHLGVDFEQLRKVEQVHHSKVPCDLKLIVILWRSRMN